MSLSVSFAFPSAIIRRCLLATVVLLGLLGLCDRAQGDVAVAPEGRIVVTGDDLMAALTSGGAPDRSFDGNGYATFRLPAAKAWPHAMNRPLGETVAAPDGAVFVSTGDTILKVSPRGALDSSYGGGDGVAELPYGTGSDIELQADGKLVSVGTAVTFCGSRGGPVSTVATIVRLDIGGGLDPTFGGGDGVAEIAGTGTLCSSAPSMQPTYPSFEGVAVQGDGRIVAGGRQTLARFNSDGSLDPTFGDDGLVVPAALINDLVVSPAQRITTVGAGPAAPVVAVRYLEDGSLDAGFGGGDGRAETGVAAPGVSAGVKMAALPDGSFAVVASLSACARCPTVAAVALMDSEGRPKIGFGEKGVATRGLPAIAGERGNFDFNLSVASTGETLLVSGVGWYGFAPTNAVTAFDQQGAATESFGRAGIVLAPRPQSCTGALKGRRYGSVGTPEADVLTGSPEPDLLIGLGGDDRIIGGDEQDLICAGSGNDMVNAGRDNDAVYGQDGNDRLLARGGYDRAWGGPGDDHLAGSVGRDWLGGGAGADVLLGGLGGDRLMGGTGDDRLQGGPGINVLLGGPGERPGSLPRRSRGVSGPR